MDGWIVKSRKLFGKLFVSHVCVCVCIKLNEGFSRSQKFPREVSRIKSYSKKSKKNKKYERTCLLLSTLADCLG